MTSAVPLWVCDSCTLIDILTDDPRYIDAIAPIKRAHTDKQIVLGVSEITVAECCKLTANSNRCPTEIVEEFLAGENSRRYPVTASVSIRANVLIRLCSLETCDALIVATALAQKASQFITRDSSTICKKIREKQKHPATLNGAKAELRPVYSGSKDEAEVIEELRALTIYEIKESVTRGVGT